jgi:hypothetical protein
MIAVLDKSEIYPSTPAVKLMLDRVNKETQAIDKVRDARNRIVHSHWIMNIQIEIGKSRTVTHITDTAIGVANRKGQEPQPYKAEGLKAVADSIASATKQLVSFMQEVVKTTGVKISPDPFPR